MPLITATRSGEEFDVQVGSEDLDLVVANGPWYVSRTGYVWNSRGVYMHRLVTGCVKGDGISVDHINHNKLDNRRENLRPGTHAENMKNQRAHVDKRDPELPVGITRRPYNRFRAEMKRGDVRLSRTVLTLDEAIEIREGWSNAS